MRPRAARCTAVAVAACAVIGVGAQPASSNSTGRLTGLTQITYGCPGPQRVGQLCERWFTFARARFAVTRNAADGKPIPTTRRTVVSDGNGHFSLVLAAGSYTVTPLAQAHTNGGRSLTTYVRAGWATRITVRFLGYPMMV